MDVKEFTELAESLSDGPVMYARTAQSPWGKAYETLVVKVPDKPDEIMKTRMCIKALSYLVCAREEYPESTKVFLTWRIEPSLELVEDGCFQLRMRFAFEEIE
jgi:hypothetical protein